MMPVINKFNMFMSFGNADSIQVSVSLISPLVIADNMDSVTIYEVNG